jgi:hypothetical protein
MVANGPGFWAPHLHTRQNLWARVAHPSNTDTHRPHIGSKPSFWDYLPFAPQGCPSCLFATAFTSENCFHYLPIAPDLGTRVHAVPWREPTYRCLSLGYAENYIDQNTVTVSFYF